MTRRALITLGMLAGCAVGDDPKPEQKNAAPRRIEWRMPHGSEWIPVVLLLGVLALAFRPARKQVARAITRARPAAAPVVQGTKPTLLGITGRYAGHSMEVPETGTTLGRDPSSSGSR